jgi:hypothetical protein
MQILPGSLCKRPSGNIVIVIAVDGGMAYVLDAVAQQMVWVEMRNLVVLSE